MASMEFKNNANSTVADNPLAAGATTLNVATGEGANFPSSFPFLLTIWDAVAYPNPGDDPGMEIDRCTARATDALTIVRGQEGTGDVAHALSEKVAMLITAGHFDDAIYGIVTKLDTVAVNANNYSHPNHTGEVTSAGDGAQTIAASAVVTAKINESAVTTAKIAASNITTTLINANAVTSTKIAAANVVATSIGTSAVTTAKIAESAVTASKIKALAVGTSEIAACAVTTAKINESAVTTAKIAASNITTTLINANAVTSTKIAAGNVVATSIGTSAVTTAKIAESAVTASKIASGTIKANIWLPAESAYLPATNPATKTEELGAAVYAGFSHADFDDTTAECIVWRVPVPDYDGGNITVTVYGRPATTPGGAVTAIFDIFTIGVANSEAFDSAVTTDTGVDITFSLNTTELQTDLCIASNNIDPANVTADDVLVIELKRNMTDTLTGDFEIVAIQLEYART